MTITSKTYLNNYNLIGAAPPLVQTEDGQFVALEDNRSLVALESQGVTPSLDQDSMSDAVKTLYAFRQLRDAEMITYMRSAYRKRYYG